MDGIDQDMLTKVEKSIKEIEERLEKEWIVEKMEHDRMISEWLKRIGERGPFYKGRLMRYRPRPDCERKIWRNS